MSRPVFRTFAFVHPDLAGPGQVPGFQVTRAGAPDVVEVDASVRQAIHLLLTTVPGERVMRPDYGCDLHRLAFSPNDETTAGLAIHYVRRALDAHEPRIDVVRLDAGPSPDDDSRLDITLEYRIRVTQQPGLLTVSFSLTGEVP